MSTIFENIKSRLDGGLISLNNGTLYLDGANIHKVKAGRNGGVIYTEGQVNVNINSTNFTDVSASGNGGIVYSSGVSTDTYNSLISFTNPINFLRVSSVLGGGAFYFDHPKLDVNMQTLINLTDVHSTSGNGGVFYIKQINSIDFTPPTGKMSTYTNFTVPGTMYGSFLYSVARGATVSISSSSLSCQSTQPNYLT